jgi:hypothetical protein
MYRHLPSFSRVVCVTDALIDDLIDVVTSPVMSSLFTILSVDEIFWLEAGGRSQDASSLAEGSHIKRDFALN